MAKDLKGINKPLEITPTLPSPKLQKAQFMGGETDEAKLITAALGDLSAGTQASANFFNTGLPERIRVSRQTVWSWANGSMKVSDRRVRIWKNLPAGDVRHGLAKVLTAIREKEAAEMPF